MLRTHVSRPFMFSCLIPVGILCAQAAFGQTITNPGFENGFTDGIGNGWTLLTHPSGAVGTDETSNTHSGNHSQKVDLPSTSPSHGGVFQTISTTAGQVYQLSFWLYTTTPGESFDEEKMEVFVGFDSLGRDEYDHQGFTENADWNVGWTRVNVPRSDRNTWLNFDREFLATGSSTTIFIRAHRKSVGGMAIWVDDFSISPVSTSSPSTHGIVAPPTAPDTTGSNMLANPDFENGFSGGVGNNWSGWTATGSGTFAPSSDLGKIGGGHYNGSALMEDLSTTTKVAFAMDPALGMLTTVKNNNPDVVTCGRIDRDWLNFWDADDATTIQKGREFAEECYDAHLYHSGIDCWQGYNEPWLETLERTRKVVLFETAFTERCHELGIRSLVLNAAVGTANTTNAPYFKDLLAIADFVGYHAYGGPNDQFQTGPEESDHALRWRTIANLYESNNWRMPPVVYTEGGTYGPWKGTYSKSTVADEYVAFGPKMMEDEWNIGETIFTVGCFGFWCGWDIDDTAIINPIKTWNVANSADARGGKSQKIEHDGSGAFSGGLVQAVSTVSDGVYWLSGWLKYETGNGGDPLDPDMAIYIGYDPTGQTSNSGAGTIVWSSDQIVSRYLTSHIWHEFGLLVEATGSQTSIWFALDQNAAGTSGKLWLDALDLRAASGTTPPSNTPPTAVAAADVTSGAAPLTVNFDGTGSSDPDQDPLTYDWDWDDGSANGSGATPSHTFNSAGTYNVVLTVDDGNGGTDDDTIIITVTSSSCTSDDLVNTGFESGLSPWTTFGDTDGVVDSGFYNITPHGGSKMFGAGINNGTQDGGAYQQVDVCDGAELEVTTYIYTRQVGGANWDVNCRIGIDPTGGTNPGSSNVVWTNWENSQNAWSQIGLTGANSVTADGTTATIFLDHWHKWGLSTNVTLFDDVELTATGGSGGTPTISLSTSSLSPSATAGTSPSNDSFTVSNSGSGTLVYTVSDNVSWLSVSPTSGTSTGEADTITVSYMTSGLSAGTYYATITVEDSNATNNPQTVSVTLSISEPPPVIGLSTSELTPVTDEGSSPSNDSFTVQNDGGGTLNYTVSDDRSWLSVSPTSGSSTGEADTITVSYSTGSLSPGVHTGTITVDDTNASNGPQTIDVTLTVNAVVTTVAEDFDSMPSWSSSYDATWGSAATWSIDSNALKAERSSGGSSAKVRVYAIDANTDYTISVYIRCPSSSTTYWSECAYRLGSHTAENFDQSSGSWTMIQKFDNGGTNGNGDTWTQYSKTFNSGSNTQISVGFKAGSSGGSGPVVRWDTLHVE